MTLVIGGKEGGLAWIVGDMAITGPGVDLRKREFTQKVIPALDGRAICAFAGSAAHGAQTAFDASKLDSGEAVLDLLVDRSRQSQVEFLYAYYDGQRPLLYLVREGKAAERGAAHMGVGFEKFQRVRHSSERDAPRGAISTFICGTQGKAPYVASAGAAIKALMSFVARRADPTVGGWPLGYTLGQEGLGFLSYLYVVGDPIPSSFMPGQALEDGSAERGGYSLSVTGLPNMEGSVVYLRQLPGGFLLVREEDRLDTHFHAAEPDEFKAWAAREFGLDISTWFDSAPTSDDAADVEVLADEGGAPALAIARRGRAISIHPLNPHDRFIVSGTSQVLQRTPAARGSPRRRAD